MAKTAENKGNKVGSTKKWLIALAVLVLIAVIVTVIVLLVPANTFSAIERLKQVSGTSFLQSNNERSNFNKVISRVSSSSLRRYSTELNDMITLSDNISIVLEYYDEHMIFAEENSTLKKNYKAIRNNLEDSINTQQSMNGIIAEINGLSENSDSHLQNLVIEFRGEFTDYISHMTKAFGALENCLDDCFNYTFTDNMSLNLTLMATTDFMTAITDDFETLLKTDKKGYTAQDYSYQSHGKIEVFDDFLQRHIIDDSDIKTYFFDDNVKTEYSTINNYFSTYLQDDFVPMIKSIENSGNYNISLTFQTEDSFGYFDAAKKFINERSA